MLSRKRFWVYCVEVYHVLARLCACIYCISLQRDTDHVYGGSGMIGEVCSRFHVANLLTRVKSDLE